MRSNGGISKGVVHGSSSGFGAERFLAAPPDGFALAATLAFVAFRSAVAAATLPAPLSPFAPFAAVAAFAFLPVMQPIPSG
jgi:hypothetical protein